MFGGFFQTENCFPHFKGIFAKVAAAKNDLWFEISSPFKKPATLDDIEINERGQ